MLTIAYLTWKEALRRRAPIISLLIAGLLLVGLFIPIRGRLLFLPPDAANAIVSSVYISLATDIVKFFASVFAIALAAGAISAELERGVLSSIFPKPIPRLSVYAGKWLGLFLFVAANVVLWDLVIWGVAHYRAPHLSHRGVWTGLPYLLLYPAMFTTLALLFSTFASFSLAAGLAICLTGVGWSEAILYLLGGERPPGLDIDLLLSLSRVAGWVMPLGRMSRWVARGIGPLPFFGREMEIGSRGPFRAIPSTEFDLVYIGLYILIGFVIGAVVLGRRDV
jgi:Cu-processing system permease protein